MQDQHFFHVETSQLISTTNKLTVFDMIIVLFLHGVIFGAWQDPFKLLKHTFPRTPVKAFQTNC